MTVGLSGSRRITKLNKETSFMLSLMVDQCDMLVGDCVGFDDLVIKYIDEHCCYRDMLTIVYDGEHPRIATRGFRAIRAKDKDAYIMNHADMMFFSPLRCYSTKVRAMMDSCRKESLVMEHQN